MAQRVLFGALGSSSGTELPLLPEPTNTPWPTWIDCLLPMITLGCSVTELERVPSCQMIAVPVQTPRRPSSHMTSVPSRLQVCASVGVVAAMKAISMPIPAQTLRPPIMTVLSALADPEHPDAALPRPLFEDIATLRDQVRDVDCRQRVGAFDRRDISRL